MKYAAIIGYKGTAYAGWQRQSSGVGVQEKVEESLRIVSGGHVAVTAAGRTDAGVHARGQVISFSLKKGPAGRSSQHENTKAWRPDKLLLALNFHLPPDISVMKVAHAPLDFDARRSALWREYRYFIWHGNAMDPLLRGMVWWNKSQWSRAETLAACALYEGTHDFGAFCKTTERPVRTVRTVYRATLRRKGNLTVFTVRGNAFLTNMVRIMAGNLQAIGYGKKNLEWLASLLDGRSRAESAMTAPAEGLYLWRVGYGQGTPFRKDGIK